MSLPTTTEDDGTTLALEAPTEAATTAPGSIAPGPTAPAASAHRRLGKRWIDDWNPEDATFWRGGGHRVATRNLWVSMFAEFLAFSVWALWSIVVPQLSSVGFTFTVNQDFWLVSIPSLVGATLRIPYTFAVPRFGGRNWTIISALLLLLPCIALAIVVQNPDTPFGVMLGAAALAGVGGGNFASSMANISFFYPEREKGKALGINAAGGNIGTAGVQLAVPLVIGAGAAIELDRAGLMLIPFIVIAAFCAWRFMDNLGTARTDGKSFAAATRNRYTWIVAFLYIGTFGSFIGYSGAFPTLLKNEFPSVTVQLAFLGALVGSVARPFGGMIADRVGGTRVTVAAYAGMAVGALGAIDALHRHSFGLFFASFMLLFVASGVGSGSIYRMIPAIFRSSIAADDPEYDRLLDVARKAAAGCLGIAGAVGAFGGFLIPRGFAISTNHWGSLVPALWVFVGVYAVMAVIVWAVFRRRGSALAASTI